MKKILIAEDTNITSLLAQMLTEEGYGVCLRNNFSDIMYDIFGFGNDTPTYEYDVFILDLMMPIKGLPDELYKKARKGIPPGWVLYRYLENTDRHLYENTIIHSCFQDRLRDAAGKDNIKYESLKILPKPNERSDLDKILNLLENCSLRERNG
jgi:CheY-like chemotaxis protein